MATFAEGEPTPTIRSTTSEQTTISSTTSASSNAKYVDPVLRDVVIALHRASMNDDISIRVSTTASLESISQQMPLMVLQTWLDQFARTNGGSSSAEYASKPRIFLLQSLEKVTDKLLSKDANLDALNVANRACIGRIIAMASEEMTRHSDVIPEVQKPCSAILVLFGIKFIDRVMDVLLLKFQPNIHPHFYVISSLSTLAQRQPIGIVPYLKTILSTMVVNVKSTKKDNFKFAYSSAITSFCEALRDYQTNINDTPDPSLTKEKFENDIDALHETLFSSWLSSRDIKVKNSVLEALGKMTSLLSNDRLTKQGNNIMSTLVSTYKKTSEPFYVTQCVYDNLEVIIEKDPTLLDSCIEQLLTAIFTQMCSHISSSADYSRPLLMKNTHEVLRCYDVLMKNHKDKLIQGLITRLGSIEEAIRVAALHVFKHILNSSQEECEDRMPSILKALHGKLSDQSFRVKRMLAQLIALLGRLGYLGGSDGKDFLDFIIHQCALEESESSGKESGSDSGESLKMMCENILLLLSTNVPSMEPVLWPHLMDYLLAPECTSAVAPITKSIVQLMTKREQQGAQDACFINFSGFKHVNGPCEIFVRMIVLAGIPFPDSRGAHILSFLQKFACNISKHIPNLWNVRIPLLQHYLSSHESSGNVNESLPLSSWDQSQWEEWLLALIIDTLTEVDLEEWTNAVAAAMTQQMSLYSQKEFQKEKRFLFRCIGVVSNKLSHRSSVMESLTKVFSETDHFDTEQQKGCSLAFGSCAENHMKSVLDKLESNLTGLHQKKTGANLFGLLRDSKTDEMHLRMRETVVMCVGQAALNAPRSELESKSDEIITKFIMSALKASNNELKVVALISIADLARKVQPKSDKDSVIKLAHQGDLFLDAIECMRNETWTLSGKDAALTASLELIRCPPYVSQVTRCSLLKGCFTAVFPALVSEFSTKEEDFVVLCKSETNLKKMVDKLQIMIQELLKQDPEQSTLDEIFTLLEPWIRKECVLSRELAMNLFSSLLNSFKDNVNFKMGSPTSFAPGPYMIGSILPRCFDISGQIQVLALKCLEAIIRILAMFEGHSEENIKDMLHKISSLSAIMSPSHNTLDASFHSKVASSNFNKVCKIVSKLLTERIRHEQLYQLIQSIVDSTSDVVDICSSGASVVLSTLIESRGNELYSHTDLMERLHAQLTFNAKNEDQSVECCSMRRDYILKSISIFCSHGHASVIDYLLSLPISAYDDNNALSSIWKVSMTMNKALASDAMESLLHNIRDYDCLCSQDKDRISECIIREGRHRPLAAIIALKWMFRGNVKEMESACESQFPEIYLPLLVAMSSYLGVADSETVIKGKRSSSNGSVQKLGPSAKQNVESPFVHARDALKAFLQLRGHSSLADIVDEFCQDDLGKSRHPNKLSNFFCKQFQIIIQDFPEFLLKLTHLCEETREAKSFGAKFTAINFFVELITFKDGCGLVELNLREQALSNILDLQRSLTKNDTTHGDNDDKVEKAVALTKHETDELQILCLKGLSTFRRRDFDDESEQNFGASVLAAFMSSIGNEFKSNVNRYALEGLAFLLEDHHKSLYEVDVHHAMSDIIAKIRPFFDCGNHTESAAAITCFSELANYATGSYKDVYLENLHGVLVSLLLHLDDNIDTIRRASVHGIRKILPVLAPDNWAHLAAFLSKDSKVDYLGFLSALGATEEFSYREGLYLDTTLTYQKSSSSRLRLNSVLLINEMIESCPSDFISEVDAKAIYQSLANLITSDKSKEVQSAAAAAIGKIFTRLHTIKSNEMIENEGDENAMINGTVAVDEAVEAEERHSVE